jgi:hypothetical protein
MNGEFPEVNTGERQGASQNGEESPASLRSEDASSRADRKDLLFQAALDFFYLQNRLYPRRAALDWVGNRYRLAETDRHLLHRGVFSQRNALKRLGLRCMGSDWLKRRLFVDGHNVQITVESAIRGRILLKANDGAVRDLAGESSRFRLSEISEMAMDVIFRFLEEFRPSETIFLFDAPMSHSGSLASAYRQRMKTMGLCGDARAVPVPEREFPFPECVAASSDQDVIDRSSHWLDLAGAALAAADFQKIRIDFSFLIMVQTKAW